MAKASNPAQGTFVGNQAGGRVFLFLQTDDFWRDYNRMVGAGANFVRTPSEEPYGMVAVFEDLYGTRWDLLQYNSSTPYISIATQKFHSSRTRFVAWLKCRAALYRRLTVGPLRVCVTQALGLMESLVSTEIKTAKSREDIALCYAILAELRPHLRDVDFVTTIERLSRNSGFKLAYVMDGDAKAVAGYRVSEWLHSGRYLENEDFITNSTDRSKGYGRQLFAWLVAQARLEGCSQLRLVSGVKRTDAHRFYARHGMVHEAQYFSLNL